MKKEKTWLQVRCSLTSSDKQLGLKISCAAEDGREWTKASAISYVKRRFMATMPMHHRMFYKQYMKWYAEQHPTNYAVIVVGATLGRHYREPKVKMFPRFQTEQEKEQANSF
jgi:hypothetical protein